MINRPVKAGEPISSLSKVYGVSDKSIYNWIQARATKHVSFLEFAKLRKENQQLKEKTAAMDEKLRDYTIKEITLQNTLVLAEKSAEDRLSSARKEADLILDEARVRASREKEMLQREIESLREEKKKIYMEREKYITDIELLAQTQLGLLKKYKGNE